MSYDPTILKVGGSKNGRRSQPLQGPSLTGAASSEAPEASLDSLTFDDFANTAPANIARSLQTKHEYNTLARVNQKDLALKREVPLTVRFTRSEPGEEKIAGNAYAMSTPSIANDGERVLHDLSNAVVYEVKGDVVNMSQDMVGLKLNAVPGTIFPNSNESGAEQEGYQVVLLPGETRKGVVFHTAQKTSDPAGLARRMLQSLNVNKVDMDNDISVHADMNGANSYFAISPESKTAAKVRSMAYHPDSNPKGKFLITNRNNLPQSLVGKSLIRTHPMSGQLLVGMDDMEQIREALGGNAVSDEHRTKDANAGYMDLGNLTLKASVIPGSSEDNIGAVYDTDSDAAQTVHARVTVSYIPLNAAAEHAGDEIASKIKAKMAGAAGRRK